MAFAPPTPNARQSLTFHKKPELQSFLKMRWRLLPLWLQFPPSFSPPPPTPHQVSSPQFWPRRPRQAGRRPQAHSSPHCHAAEIRDTSSGWAPAKRFKLKSGKGGPGPQLSLPRVKDAWETSACSPWDAGLKLDMGAGAVTHHTHKTHPPIPRFPKYSSEPQAPDIATSNLHF